MPKILISYYSKSGHTKEMAEWIHKGIEKDIEAVVKDVADVKATELENYDAIIMGSPTYYGTMAAEMKKLLDESVSVHGKLEGKIGGAFASSGMLGGGNETTVRSIIDALLIHGMIVIGSARTAHYGPVAIGKPDEKARKECIYYGERISRLVKKLS